MPHGVQSDPRIRLFDHMRSYAEFIRFQAGRNWAIGMAPLLDHSSNRAKTNNKYREYGACGIPGAYSDMPPYQGSVQPGVTGVLVKPAEGAWASNTSADWPGTEATRAHREECGARRAGKIQRCARCQRLA